MSIFGEILNEWDDCCAVAYLAENPDHIKLDRDTERTRIDALNLHRGLSRMKHAGTGAKTRYEAGIKKKMLAAADKSDATAGVMKGAKSTKVHNKQGQWVDTIGPHKARTHAAGAETLRRRANSIGV